jgi:hypothetical protein
VWLLGRDSGHIALPFVIVLLYLAAFRGRICSAIFSNPIITDIGGMCYSIYLFHFIIIYGVKHFSASLTALLRNLLPSDRAPLHGSGMAHETVAPRPSTDAIGGAAATILNRSHPESSYQLRDIYVTKKRGTVARTCTP